MIQRYVLSFIIFVFLFSCSGQKPESNSFFIELKKLEYSRDSDIRKWENLFRRASTLEQKEQFVLSVGKTKNDSLFSLLKNLFKTFREDTLLSLSSFSISQIDNPQRESFLLSALQRENFSPGVKNNIIKVLGNCGSNQSISVLRQYLKLNEYHDAAFYSLGLLARKGFYSEEITSSLFDSSHAAAPNPAESYFLYYTDIYPQNFSQLVRWLTKSDYKSQALLSKKLNKLLAKTSISVLDSLSKKQLRDYLVSILNKAKAPWALIMYSIPLTRFYSDSVIISSLEKLSSYPNLHVRIAALKALSEIAPLKALPLLTQRFSELPETFEKGAVCKIIAKTDRSTAYLLINENLDKGNPFFRKLLLEAIGITRLPLAIRTLHQFLKVNDPVLSNGAFLALSESNQIKRSDLQIMINSPNFSNVANIAEWYIQNNKTPEKQTLWKLYKKFNKPDHFELQLSLARLLQKNYPLKKAEIDSLIRFAAHPYLREKIYSLFEQPVEINRVPLDVLPVYLQPDSLIFDDGRLVFELLTTKGSIQIRLFPEYAPLTVKNFIYLAERGFYKNIYFHRVVPDFVVQAGDPTGTGWGGPGYLIPSEHSPKPFVRGSVGMATAGFDTGGSQFFICYSDQPHLNGNYTVFGKVINGMSVVDQIEVGDQILTIKRVQ